MNDTVSPQTRSGWWIAGFLLALVPVWFLRSRLPGVFVANALFLLPVLAASIGLSTWLERGSASGPPRRGATLGLLLAAFAWFVALGLLMNRSVGEHSGDEGHYLIQARSLWQDHDLDIANNLQEAGAFSRRSADPRIFHISPLARDGHWYSWHLPGLSLFLAPTVPMGPLARHLMLAGIATLALGGVLALGRRTGAPERAMLIMTALFAFGLFWSVYAARALPETLGAACLAWLMWAMTAIDERPRISAAVACLCFVVLLWTQSRFGPLALLGGGCFGLRILMTPGPWRRRLCRAASFAVPAGLGLLHFLWMQRQLFDGGLPLRSSDFLFNYWPGLYLALLSERGLFYSLPSAAWLLPALAVWIWRDRQNRFIALSIAALLAVNAVLSTSNNIFPGGACLPGRYHLCVVPLLLPAAAHAFAQASRFSRALLVFLSLFGTAMLLIMVAALPDLRKAFTLPLGNVEGVWPVMRGLLHPWASKAAFFSGGAGVALGLVFALVLLAGATLSLLFPLRRWSRICVISAMAAATVAGHVGNARADAGKDKPTAAIRE